jgi:hypothetical protein
LNPTTISIAYVIVKTLQDELIGYYMTSTYEYNKCFTFMMLVNNWMVWFGNFFIARKRGFGLEYKDDNCYKDNKKVGMLAQQGKPCARQTHL